jgi:hypothetical protein
VHGCGVKVLAQRGGFWHDVRAYSAIATKF